MPKFNYKARSHEGSLVTGEVEAENAFWVRSQIDSMGYIPVSIKEITPGILDAINEHFTTISLEDKLIFSRQFSTLISAGVSITEGLAALSEQCSNTKFARIIDRIKKDIESGSSLSEAMQNFPDVFDYLYIGMIKAGEAGGVLDSMLDRISTLLEYEVEHRQRIKAALSYPKKIAMVAIFGFIVISTFAFPVFEGIYEREGAKLPKATRLMIDTSRFIKQYFILFAAGSAAFVWLVKKYIRTNRGRLQWDSIKLKIPVFGEIILKASLSKFSRVFATLTAAGLPVIDILEIASWSSGNHRIGTATLSIKDAVEKGEGLVAPMKMTNVFTPVVIQMVSVGEETGKMDEVLEKVSEYYDRDVNYALKSLSANIEPYMLILLAIMVFMLALGVFQPYWRITYAYIHG